MDYEPGLADGYRVNADRALTEEMLASLWPVYRRSVLPSRRPGEFNQSRTRVYVESRTVKGEEGERHYVVIGHVSYRLPEAMDDGSLAWLGGLSSGLTEIVFLGETWSDPARRTNKRIEFLRSHGYPACANAYADFAFPRERTPEVAAVCERLEKAGYRGKDLERRAVDAVAQIKASAALLDGRLERHAATLFPPLLAYPDAWAAYVAHCEQDPSDPPLWFHREFLDRLGFERMAIDGSLRHQEAAAGE
jgi:hypothetical protein